MKLRMPFNPRRPIHFCGWDRECRSVHAPWFLYLHFLVDDAGHSIRVDLSPPWVRRAERQWVESLNWQEMERS